MFGRMFDFNWDGKSDAVEVALAFSIMDDLEKEDDLQSEADEDEDEDEDTYDSAPKKKKLGFWGALGTLLSSTPSSSSSTRSYSSKSSWSSPKKKHSGKSAYHCDDR